MNDKGPLIITGASGGIGRATALAAQRAGWEVIATSRSTDDIDSAIRTETLDITDVQGCAELFDRIKPTALVNCAGFGSAGAIEDMHSDDGLRHMNVMAIAPIRLCQLALPHMRKAGEGHIVNLSSLGGRTSAPLTGWYTASKHALESLTDALRVEVAPDNINVSLIEPGGVTTGILEKSVANSAKSERYADAYDRAYRLTKFFQSIQSDASHVADVIVKALDSSRPKARYVVGADARLLLLAGKIFPVGIRDAVKRKVLSI